MSPSKLRRCQEHFAKFGRVFTPEPPTRDDLYRRQPQLCRECNNSWAGRTLLPPDEGRFFTDHNGIRWVCYRCVKLHKMSPSASPGEQRMAKLLAEHHIRFIPQYVLLPNTKRKKAYDFYLPDWNLLVEIDSWSAHHTAAQKKKDYWRDKLALQHGIHLIRVNWKDRNMLEKVMAAKEQGRALRAEAGGR